MRINKFVTGMLASAAIIVAILALIIAVNSPIGCASHPPIGPNVNRDPGRQYQLMLLAVDAAKDIADAHERLKRQLNLADMQINRSRNADAAATLTDAADTLKKDGGKLTNHTRLSGWVSVSELSRRAGLRSQAEAACGEADKALHTLDSLPERCQYVMGIARELHALYGPPKAIELLREAGPWAKKIDNPAERRKALSGFAAALFNLDAFSDGQAVLKQDDDAIWRTDTLTAMSQPAPGSSWLSSSRETYGKQMDYNANFRQQARPND